MSDFKKNKAWGCVRILTVGVLVVWSAAQGLSALAQQVVIIPNTASANFQDPSGRTVNAVSNQVTVPVIPTEASLEVTKSADRASAEPGDTVVYRLLVRNTGRVPLNNIQVTDTLPLGVSFLPRSPRATLTNSQGTAAVALPPAVVNGRTILFTYPRLEPQEVLTLVYGATLTPDAIRGSGRNVAVAAGVSPSGVPVASSAASFVVQIRPGILSDCGTIIGRVFVDKNFDGEQQPGEPGVPNAVIYMEDGNRVVTDANGLYSLSYVVAGQHTGTLDLTSLPGYVMAPNRYRIEGNSQSRLVKLAPGSLAKMNFAVTPSFKEGQR